MQHGVVGYCFKFMATQETETQEKKMQAPEGRAGKNSTHTSSQSERNGKTPSQQRGRGRRRSGFGGGDKRAGRARQQRSDIEFRILSARRVSRVVAGGRRFSLSVAVAVGNGKGEVGIGVSKGADMAIATEKARNKAQKRMVKLPLTPEKGIPCEGVGKYCASVVHVRPAKGFVAGSAVRTIAELAGIQSISAKVQSRSKNRINTALATLKALQSLSNDV